MTNKLLVPQYKSHCLQFNQLSGFFRLLLVQKCPIILLHWQNSNPLCCRALLIIMDRGYCLGICIYGIRKTQWGILLMHWNCPNILCCCCEISHAMLITLFTHCVKVDAMWCQITLSSLSKGMIWWLAITNHMKLSWRCFQQNTGWFVLVWLFKPKILYPTLG